MIRHNQYPSSLPSNHIDLEQSKLIIIFYSSFELNKTSKLTQINVLLPQWYDY